jgi:hypothetical protein
VLDKYLDLRKGNSHEMVMTMLTHMQERWYIFRESINIKYRKSHTWRKFAVSRKKFERFKVFYSEGAEKIGIWCY